MLVAVKNTLYSYAVLPFLDQRAVGWESLVDDDVLTAAAGLGDLRTINYILVRQPPIGKPQPRVQTSCRYEC